MGGKLADGVFEGAYPIVLAGGAAASLLWLGLGRPPKGAISSSHRLDAGLLALALGILGARLGYVALHLPYYSTRPIEALWFWQGGLSWVAGAIGATVGVGVYARLAQRSALEMADSMAFPAVGLSIAAWFGCMLDGCAYGMKSAAFPATQDLLGHMAPRWPTQALGTILGLLALLALWRVSERPAGRGFLGALSLTLIAGVNFALAFVRADPISFVWGIRLDILASGVVFTAGAVACLALRGSNTNS